MSELRPKEISSPGPFLRDQSLNSVTIINMVVSIPQ